MTIKTELHQVLALVTAQTQAIGALTTAVANLGAGTAATTDLSGVIAMQEKILAATTDIQNQLEGDDTPATPETPVANDPATGDPA